MSASRLLTISTVLLLSSCVEDPDIGGGHGGRADDFATFEDFKDSLYCEPDTGVCIVSGDIPVFGDEALRELFEQHRTSSGALTVFRVGREETVWDRTARFELTYCVSREFGDRHGDVAVAIDEAARDWEEVAEVDFRYLPEQDDDCNIDNDAVLFDVSPSPDDAPYLARAFFPTWPRDFRQVLVNLSDIDAFVARPDLGGRPSMRGIFRHELGHTLGFRHEHIRPENAGNLDCFEDEFFRPLTEYDSKSTMHYPQCDGEGDWSLELTFIDEQGARFFYPDFERFRGDRCTIEVKGNGRVNEDCEPLVHEILELANTASFEILDEWVGLDVRAVEEIHLARATHPFLSLQQLRDVTFLDDATIRRMYDYLYVDGRCPIEVDNEGRVDFLCRPVMHRVLELANKASLEELDVDARLDSRAAENIVARRAEEPFTDLVDLWSVSFTKSRALRKMYEYIYAD